MKEKETNDSPSQMLLLAEGPLAKTQKTIRLDALPADETFASRQPSAAFRKSVERLGIISPILVSPRSENDEWLDAAGDPAAQYRILAGRRRVLAARAVGIEEILAVVFPRGTTPTAAVALIENEQREENPLVELRIIQEVLAAGGSLDDVCEATGMPKRRAEKRMRLAALVPELVEALQENRIAVSVAERAARLTPEEQRRLVAGASENGGKIRGQDVADARRVETSAAVAALPASMFGGEDGFAPVVALRPGEDGFNPSLGKYWIASTGEAVETVAAVLAFLREPPHPCDEEDPRVIAASDLLELLRFPPNSLAMAEPDDDGKETKNNER